MYLSLKRCRILLLADLERQGQTQASEVIASGNQVEQQTDNARRQRQ
jgi:hypothetical protein